MKLFKKKLFKEISLKNKLYIQYLYVYITLLIKDCSKKSGNISFTSKTS